MPAKKHIGTAQIPMEEYLSLINAEEDAQALKERCLKAMSHVQTLINFLLASKNEEVAGTVRKTIFEFNTKSDAAFFRIVDDHVLLEMKEAQDG